MMTLKQFAWRVAGPREFVIDAAINGAIAWLLFRDVDEVPLTGRTSLAVMLAPMSFLLASLTTFFGYLSGVVSRKQQRVSPSLDKDAKWIRPALRASLGCGVVTLAMMAILLIVMDRLAPGVRVPMWAAVGGIGGLSGGMGFVLHLRAVLQTGKL